MVHLAHTPQKSLLPRPITTHTLLRPVGRPEGRGAGCCERVYPTGKGAIQARSTSSTLERACSMGTGPPWEPPAGPCTGISGKERGVVNVIPTVPTPRVKWSSVAKVTAHLQVSCPAPSDFWKTGSSMEILKEDVQDPGTLCRATAAGPRED